MRDVVDQRYGRFRLPTSWLDVNSGGRVSNEGHESLATVFPEHAKVLHETRRLLAAS